MAIANINDPITKSTASFIKDEATSFAGATPKALAILMQAMQLLEKVLVVTLLK